MRVKFLRPIQTQKYRSIYTINFWQDKEILLSKITAELRIIAQSDHLHLSARAVSLALLTALIFLLNLSCSRTTIKLIA
jgi:hypothetical protein